MLSWVSAPPKINIGIKKQYENAHVPLPLDIMYVKLHKIIMDKKLMKSTKIWFHEMNKHTLHYKLLQHNKIHTYIPYNWLVFLAVNNGYTSSYALIRIRY